MIAPDGALETIISMAFDRRSRPDGFRLSDFSENDTRSELFGSGPVVENERPRWPFFQDFLTSVPSSNFRTRSIFPASNGSWVATTRLVLFS